MALMFMKLESGLTLLCVCVVLLPANPKGTYLQQDENKVYG
jgi:hypothetical protein